jgi:hypothetical protein
MQIWRVWLFPDLGVVVGEDFPLAGASAGQPPGGLRSGWSGPGQAALATAHHDRPVIAGVGFISKSGPGCAGRPAGRLRLKGSARLCIRSRM